MQGGVVLQNDEECVPYGSIWNLVEGGSIWHQQGFCYYKPDIVTVEPSSTQNHAQRILHQSEEPFHHAKNHLRMKRFYIELMVLNGSSD